MIKAALLILLSLTCCAAVCTPAGSEVCTADEPSSMLETKFEMKSANGDHDDGVQAGPAKLATLGVGMLDTFFRAPYLE